MKIRLRKKIHPNGDVWFHIDVNGTCTQSRQNEIEARDIYQTYVKSVALAHEEILESFDTDAPQEGK